MVAEHPKTADNVRTSLLRAPTSPTVPSRTFFLMLLDFYCRVEIQGRVCTSCPATLGLRAV